MENKVLLSDIVLKWLKYREVLQQGEIGAEQAAEFDKIFPQIFVKDYLPMKQKEALVSQIIWYTFDSQKEEDYLELLDSYEISLILYGLMGYTTIENDLHMAALSPAIVDVLYECGFVDKILAFCTKDYDRLCTMADRAVNFRTGLEMLGSISAFDPQRLQELTQGLKGTLGGLRPDSIKGLVKIAQANDPATLAVAEALDRYGVIKTKEDVEKIINIEK